MLSPSLVIPRPPGVVYTRQPRQAVLEFLQFCCLHPRVTIRETSFVHNHFSTTPPVTRATLWTIKPSASDPFCGKQSFSITHSLSHIRLHPSITSDIRGEYCLLRIPVTSTPLFIPSYPHSLQTSTLILTILVATAGVLPFSHHLCAECWFRTSHNATDLAFLQTIHAVLNQIDQGLGIYTISGCTLPPYPYNHIFHSYFAPALDTYHECLICSTATTISSLSTQKQHQTLWPSRISTSSYFRFPSDTYPILSSRVSQQAHFVR